MGSASVAGGRPVTTEDVRSLMDDFHVLRVAARWVAAQMVDDFAARDWARKHEVRDAVSKMRWEPLIAALAVPVAVAVSRPLDAVG